MIRNQWPDYDLVMKNWRHQVRTIIGDQIAIDELEVRVVLNPRPHWMPVSLWRKLLRLLIRIEYLPVEVFAAPPSAAKEPV